MPFKSYQMYLIFDGGNSKIRFPVLPDKVTVNCSSENKSVDISGLGELIVKQDRPAVTVEFSCFFPAYRFPGLKVKTIQRPEGLMKRIKKWKDSQKPCQFMITETAINLFCYIDTFKYEERAGDKGTIYYTIKLREYRTAMVRRMEVSTDGKTIISGSNQLRADTRVQPKTYTVQEGDTLSIIALKTLGSGAYWMDILRMNPSVVKGPSLLSAGSVLKLPDNAIVEVVAMEK